MSADAMLAHRRYLRRMERITRIIAAGCPCPKCCWSHDVARAALELWDVRLLMLVPKPFKKSIKALSRG